MMRVISGYLKGRNILGYNINGEIFSFQHILKIMDVFAADAVLSVAFSVCAAIFLGKPL